MKNLVLPLLAIALYSLTAYAKAFDMQAYFSYSRYYAPGQGNYIEANLQVEAGSLKLQKTASGKFQGEVEATYIFSRNDSIVRFSKTSILSPEIDDTANVQLTFMDRQLILLEPGMYDFKIIISDKNDTVPPFTNIESIEIADFAAKGVFLSDISFIDSWEKTEVENSFTKGGYQLIPYLSDFYPENTNKLTFYCEVYGTEELTDSDAYLLRYYFEVFETGRPINNYIRFKRQKTSPLSVVIAEIPIAELPSGNYNLIVEVRDRDNNVLTSGTIFFQRSNPSYQMKIEDIALLNTAGTFVDNIKEKERLLDNIHSSWPIATVNERRFIDEQIKYADNDMLRKFIFRFWEVRSLDPETAWKEYNLEVEKVQNSFGTRIKKGYQTDRGRVYLQYGPPNQIVSEKLEPSAYPYEIWHYYSMGNQRNKKFVFYSPMAVTNDYLLIHSDAIGEIYDKNWQYKIHKRNNPWEGVDQEGLRDSEFGSNSRRIFQNPY